MAGQQRDVCTYDDGREREPVMKGERAGIWWGSARLNECRTEQSANKFQTSKTK